MIRITRYFAWKFFRNVGTRDAMLPAPRGLIERSRLRRSHFGGPYNGKDLFRVHPRAGRMSVSRTVAKTISGGILKFWTASRPSHQATALQGVCEMTGIRVCRSPASLECCDNVSVCVTVAVVTTWGLQHIVEHCVRSKIAVGGYASALVSHSCTEMNT
jgi:hypothetical protein